ncbi:hypothetical protein SEA_XKCD426_34 [Streptomyces phage Xkcd426]|nr:hypothetical protein SEA_XKCD426_34 [Streptomyces phage Xkcd426]
MNRTYFKALFELVALTYAVAFLGLVTADGFDIVSLAAWKSAAVAAFPPVLVAVYGVVARLAGNFASPLAVDTRDRS